MGDVADLLAVEALGLQAADLEDELGVAVVHDGDLGVGRLALVAIAEPAAQAEDGLGERRAGAVPARARSRDQPAGNVHLVDALVADVAVAEVPEPVPVVMDQVGVIRLLRGRAEPDVEIELLGRIRDRFDADAAARLVAQGPRDQQLAELARLDRRGGQGPVAAGAALRAVLDDPVVPPRGLDGDPAFVDVVAARFFDVDVLARLAGPDRDQGVPVVGRGDRDGVDRLVVEHAADVLHGGRRPAALLLDLVEPLLVRPRVGIDQVRDLDARHHSTNSTDVFAASAVEPGHGETDRVVGPDDPARRLGPADRKARPHPGGSQGSIHELATTQV